MDPQNPVPQVPLVSPVPPVVPPQPVPVPTPPVPIPPKQSPLTKIALGVLLLSCLALLGYLVMNLGLGKKQTACTAEAKICPDGTSVGRTGPNCEFAPCPTVSPTPVSTPDLTANWKTYINDVYNYSIKYPLGWRTQVQAAGAGDKEAGSKSSLVDIFKLGAENQYPLYRLSIEPFEIMSGQTIESIKGPYLKFNLVNPKTANVRINNIDTITIEGKISTSQEQKEFYSKVYIIQFPQKNNGLTILTRDDINKTEASTFDQILSTFKFLEPQTSPSATP